MFSEILNIQPGITAVIGSGGKTTLLSLLGNELAAQGHTVILGTTTKISPFDTLPCILCPDQVKDALQTHRLICTGTQLDSGKLGPSPLSAENLARLADYVILECDGSHRLPLKAHLPHEPVIPPSCQQVLCVVGLSGLNRPIEEAVHRPQRFSQICGLSCAAPASPEAVAQVLNRENLADQYLLNQAEDALPQGQALKAMLGKPAILTSLKTGNVFP